MLRTPLRAAFVSSGTSRATPAGSTLLDAGERLHGLAEKMREIYLPASNAFQLVAECGEGVLIDSELLSRCLTIIDELTLNSIKYAYPEGRTGRIVMGIAESSERTIHLTVEDDGAGFQAAPRAGSPVRQGLAFAGSGRRWNPSTVRFPKTSPTPRRDGARKLSSLSREALLYE
jgi:hypothetical protein